MSTSETKGKVFHNATEILKHMKEEDAEGRKRRKVLKLEVKRAARLKKRSKTNFYALFTPVLGLSKCCATSIVERNTTGTTHCSRCMKLVYVRR